MEPSERLVLLVANSLISSCEERQWVMGKKLNTTHAHWNSRYLHYFGREGVQR